MCGQCPIVEQSAYCCMVVVTYFSAQTESGILILESASEGGEDMRTSSSKTVS